MTQGAHMAFDTRKYVIIPTSQIHLVDFTQVLETSADTCRYSVDGVQTFVKYDGNMPASVQLIQNKSPEYSHEEIMNILSGADWTSDMPMID
jgi:hypothetical protein